MVPCPARIKSISRVSNTLPVQDSYANGVLTVTDGSSHSAKLSFNGSYSLANFSFASDGGGGTIVYDPPVPPSSSQKAASVTSAITGNGETLDFLNPPPPPPPPKKKKKKHPSYCFQVDYHITPNDWDHDGLRLRRPRRHRSTWDRVRCPNHARLSAEQYFDAPGGTPSLREGSVRCQHRAPGQLYFVELCHDE